MKGCTLIYICNTKLVNGWDFVDFTGWLSPILGSNFVVVTVSMVVLYIKDNKELGFSSQK